VETDSDTQKGHEATILEFIDREHGRTGRPVLLSQVGTDFSVKFGQFRKFYPLSLSAYIREHLSEKLHFPPGQETGPGAAVEPVSVHHIGSSSTDTGAAPFPDDQLDRYPRSLVIAFCLKPTDATDVYYSLDPPFRYHEIPAHDPAPGPRYRLIEKELRIGKRFVDLTANDRIFLTKRISDWIRQNDLDTIITHRKTKSSTYTSTTPHHSNMTALQRLIQAQPTELRERLLIPADIAAILLNH
jgi:hypothetical protein